MAHRDGWRRGLVLADVANDDQVAALISAALERYGRLDYAHNNGGIEGPLETVAGYQEEDWQRVVDINLTGVWCCRKHEIPAILANGGGAIVNAASVSGQTGFPLLLPACVASEFGVVGLTAVDRSPLRARGHQDQCRLPRSHRHADARSRWRGR